MTAGIEDYALISDCRSAALVARNGSVDWLCMPRFDSPAMFASLVGAADNGHWSIAPADPATVERSYVDDSMVLETLYRTASGTVRVTDALVMGDGPHRLVRHVEGVSGSVPMHMQLVVRFDYGSVLPWVRRAEEGLIAIGGPDAIILRTVVDLRGEDLRTVSDFVVDSDRPISFELTWFRSHEEPPDAIDVAGAIGATVAGWQSWADNVSYEGAYRDDVRRSLLVLKALSYQPTGAIIAAPTTSLPEWIGGSRNWDYRYCWLRDATFTLLALLQVGCAAEAASWRDWLIRAIAGDPSGLQIMYGVAGERRLAETELDWLDGFEGSRPVRVGNAAFEQLQIDVFGEVMDAMHQARTHGIGPNPAAWNIQRAMLGWLENHWHSPDEGIWEVRGRPAHFTYSKVMAWVAFDRGVRAVEDHGLPGDVDRWSAIRDEIHAEVCREAVDDRGVFTQSYGSSALDASTLMIPLVGFLPPTDERVVATVNAVQDELTVGGLVQRYSVDDAHDGVGGEEGTFLLCTFWLVDCLALMGRTDEATALFERLLSLRNDLGLLAEEYDPSSGRQLGNFPQAFSHIGLIGSAITLCPGHLGPSERRSR